MIADKILLTDQLTGAATLSLTFRETAAKGYETIKKKFANRRAAQIFLKMKKKNVFVCQLNNYMIHCKQVIDYSNYPQQSKHKAYSDLQILRDYANGRNGVKELTEIARFTLMNKRNLYAILPNALNKGYHSALANYDEIIKEAQEITGVNRLSQMR